MEKEEQERQELRKIMMMSDSDNDPRRKKDIKKEEDDLNSMANYTGQPGMLFVFNVPLSYLFHQLHWINVIQCSTCCEPAKLDKHMSFVFAQTLLCRI